MSLIKNEIPILEYDSDPTAVLMPGRNEDFQVPEKVVYLFLEDEVEKYAAAHDGVKLGEFITITKTYPIFKVTYKGFEIGMCQAPLGGAAAAQFMDLLIALGARQIISAGSCGALVHIEENEFLIPTKALRADGASYHYLPPARYIELNASAIHGIKKALDLNGMTYEECLTWTTDGFFRETKEMVQYRKEEGCKTVEMECASLAACAKFRDIIFGQLLYTADTLADVDNQDDRGWGEASMSIALILALEAVINI